MQRANVTLRLSGDLLNTIRKTNVSPAEIVVLRFIHGGPDSVVDIQPTIMDKMPHQQERARLVEIYGGDVIERIFPGQFAKLPVSLRDVEPIMEEADEPESQEEEGDQAEAVMPPNGHAPETGDDLTDEDKAIIAMIQDAHSKGELRAIATANEVEVATLPDNLPDMKLHVIRSLFPMYRV